MILHLHFSGVFHAAAGPEDPYLKALAIHLTEVGTKFYGASWCPHCNDQKELFRNSAYRLPYVECSPRGRNGPPARACAVLDIRNFPTWMIDGRRYTQLLGTDSLARYSGFRRNERKP